MRAFLTRISSRKFLTAVTVQAAAIVAFFVPAHGSTLNEAAVRIASLATLLLAAMGYGRIEAALDESHKP